MDLNCITIKTVNDEKIWLPNLKTWQSKNDILSTKEIYIYGNFKNHQYSFNSYYFHEYKNLQFIYIGDECHENLNLYVCCLITVKNINDFFNKKCSVLIIN